MKTEAWVYGAVAVLCVGAGVAIAGFPDSVSRQPTIRVPETVPSPAPTSTVPSSTASESTSTAVESTSTAAESTTTGAESTTTEGRPDPTVTAEIVTPVTAQATTTTTESLPERSAVEVSVVNGADVGGVGLRTSQELAELGYTDVNFFDGTEIIDRSTVFVSDESRAVALRVAEEVGISADAVLAIEAAPAVEGLGDTVVIVYLGRDVELLSLFS